MAARDRRPDGGAKARRESLSISPARAGLSAMIGEKQVAQQLDRHRLRLRDPELDNLRSARASTLCALEPRYQSLMRRVGLAE